MRFLTLLFTIFIFNIQIIATTPLETAFSQKHPFKHDLHPTVIPGKNSTVTVCLHGFGNNYQLAEKIKTLGIEDTLVSFNFPDHGLKKKKFLPIFITSFGSIDELLPPLYILKTCVVDAKIEKINLYGFSAGGGALVNTIAVLQTSTYDAELKKIGIDAKTKEQILTAIQQGTILLDTPLKSLEEIIAHRGRSLELVFSAWKYKKNRFRPIDSLCHLNGFNVIVHFQTPDKILSNRDDELYIQELRKHNTQGKVHVVMGSDEGGHNGLHPTLWNYYLKGQL